MPPIFSITLIINLIVWGSGAILAFFGLHILFYLFESVPPLNWELTLMFLAAIALVVLVSI